MKKLIIIFCAVFSITACLEEELNSPENKISKVTEDSKNNIEKEDQPKEITIDTKALEQEILRLEQEGKIPRADELDRTNTLTGIDANNNGVRDDVEKWINKKYPNQIPEAMQFARSMQRMMTLDVTDELALIKSDFEETRAINCLFLKAREKKRKGIMVIEADKLMDQIGAITTNTRERVLVEIRVSEAMSGRVLSMGKEDGSCDND